LSSYKLIVAINGNIPHNVVPISGKVVEGYFGPEFQYNPKGGPTVRYKGVTFMHFAERSDGVVEATIYF
jgi:hypothetical protein